jgi:hypothetical protein
MQLLESLRGRHRTMTTNPIIRFGRKRAHTQTTVLGQLKKSQQNRASALSSCKIPAKNNDGPADFAGSAHRMCGSTPIRSHQPELLD